MKKLGMFALAFALVLGLTQCKKENTTASNGDGAKVPITLNVSSGNRVAVETETGVVTFENDDVIYVASNGVCVGTLSYDGTQFAGEVTEPTEGQKLQFYFLGNKTPEFNADNTSCSVVISDQTEYLPVISYAPSRENYQVGLTAYNATLLNKCALVKFDVTTASDAATCILGMNNKVTVDFTTNEFVYSQYGEGMITLPSGSGEQWAILLPQDEMTEAQAQSNDGTCTGTCGTIPSVVENDFLTEGIEVNLSDSHEYVDLGLPSGTLWATCNVGANTPEELGDKFAWGETVPKDTYNWVNYQHCTGGNYSYPYHNMFTKYCNNSSYGYEGFTDDLTTLLPEDDAATANWGNDWRMPTVQEMTELRDHTTYTLTTQNGVLGFLFTAENGNSLFMPCYYTMAGYEEAIIRTSSLDENEPYLAICSFIYPNNDFTSYGNKRYLGLFVRPVRSAQ